MLIVALLACTPDEAQPKNKNEPPQASTPSLHEDPVLPSLTLPTDTGTPLAADPGATLLNPTRFHTILIDLDDEATANLGDNPTWWQHARVEIDGVAIDDAAVRLKGNGSFQELSGKASWRVSTDRYVDGQELDGLDSLVINNMITDPSMVREHAAYIAYRRLDIPAPRSAYAQLLVNGQPKGLMVFMEGTDRTFLERWYDDGSGSLWELFDAEFVSEDIERFDHDGGPDEREILYELAKALEPVDARLSADAGHLIDVEQFARYFAVSGVLGQFDAYPFSVPGDDIYLYVDPSDGRLDVLPHGADEVFNDALRPVDFAFGELAQACLRDAVCEQLWAEALWDTVNQLERTDYHQEVSDLWDNLEPLRWADGWQQFDAATRDADRDTLLEFIGLRRDALENMPGVPLP